MKKTIIVSDLVDALDRIAPLARAAEWDNVGLLAGRRDWPAQRVLVALDLTDAVAREAISERFDAALLYHPPIFREIKCVTESTPGPTGLLPDLLAARVSLVAVHTALDAAIGGTNDLLLSAVGAANGVPLEVVVTEGQSCKLAVFVPPSHLDRVRAALAEAGAGVIGRYDECSFALEGQGTFRGDETTRPAVGRKQVLERVAEVRLEMALPRARVDRVVRALYATHPYEEPAFDIYPVHEVAGRAAIGNGRVASLPRPQTGEAILKSLAKAGVDLTGAQCVGDMKRRFSSVTAAAGSFGVRLFRQTDSLVLTGEFKHHDALDLQRRGITAIMLGHYASEQLVIPYLTQRLREELTGARVQAARTGQPPLRPVKRR